MNQYSFEIYYSIIQRHEPKVGTRTERTLLVGLDQKELDQNNFSGCTRKNLEMRLAVINIC